MANMKFIIALFASLALVGAAPISHQERIEALERHIDALAYHAEQLHNLARVHQRDFASFDDYEEVVERGQSGSSRKATVHLYCEHSVPSGACSKAKDKVQKMYAGDKNLHKFENADIFVPNGSHEKIVRHVAVAFYNGLRRPASAHTINVTLV